MPCNNTLKCMTSKRNYKTASSSNNNIKNKSKNIYENQKYTDTKPTCKNHILTLKVASLKREAEYPQLQWITPPHLGQHTDIHMYIHTYVPDITPQLSVYRMQKQKQKMQFKTLHADCNSTGAVADGHTHKHASLHLFNQTHIYCGCMESTIKAYFSLFSSHSKCRFVLDY